MSELGSCVKCEGKYPYEDGNLIICPECGHEWTAHEINQEKLATELSKKVLDAYNNELSDGDNVVVIQDLRYGGSSDVIKKGTTIRGVRLITENVVDGHNLGCRVDGVGAIDLKSEFVKKA